MNQLLNRQMLLTLIAFALLCGLGPLAFEFAAADLVIPITLQSLLVIFLAICLGPKNGTLVVIGYLIVGALGLPVFADHKSGIAVFKSASAGFLIGFVPTAYFAGWLVSILARRNWWRLLLCFIAAQVFLLGWGAAGLLIYGLDVGRVVSILSSLLPGLVVKSIIGSLGVLCFDAVSTYLASPATNTSSADGT